MFSIDVECNTGLGTIKAIQQAMNQEMASAQVVLNDKLQNVPEIIVRNGGVAHFAHLKGNQGSKAALVYTLTTDAGVRAAVILGWCAPAQFDPVTSPNKVFGAVGPKQVIDNMTFDQIEELVDKAGSSVVIEDLVCMHATILNNPIAKMADLLANFSICPKP
ncbi:uncharacterized protein LOC141650966 [Silene latifolia]|uniref:uncharacterized protein LOC141650966 n=1 Tax=Silene latifolia TaxID=37657 RepID=UPI003D7874A4